MANNHGYDPLLPLAEALSDNDPVDWDALVQTLDADDREAAAVLTALIRLAHLEPPLAADDAMRCWGPYELIEMIGRGSFGQVYRARDPRLDRVVALKLRSNITRDEERSRETILSEGRLLARVRHPGIATVFGVEEHEGRIGLVMELIDGETLDQVVSRRGCLSAREAALVGVDLCRALAALHHLSIIHRDVKAQNVMREAGGRIVLVDFGIGLDLSTQELDEVVSGTPLYMAPEVLFGNRPTAHSDLYSLGVLLYLLVSGAFPVEAETLAELRSAHERQIFTPVRDVRPDVPRSFAEVIEDCLAPSHLNRPRSAGILEKRLLAILYPRSAANDPYQLFRGAAATVAVVGAALLTGYFIAPDDHSKTTLPPPSRTARLIVAEIVNRTGEPLFDHSVEKVLRLALDRSPRLQLMPRARVLDTLRRMQRSPDIRFEDDLAREVCEREGFDAFLRGVVQATGDGYNLVVEGENCEDGRLLFQEEWSFGSADLLTTAADHVAQAIETELGSIPLAERKPLEKATTSSLKALWRYSRGTEFQLMGRVEEACEMLRAAIRDDPEFAIAHAQLASCLNALGDFAGALVTAESAFELRQRATERERARIEAMFYVGRLWYEKAAEAARGLTVIYPNDAEAQRLLAHLEARLGRPPDAIGAARRAAELEPSPVNEGVLALFLIEAGHFEEALKTCSDARQNDAPEPYLDWVEGIAALGLNRVDRAEELFARLADQGGSYDHAGRHWLAQTAAYQRRFAAAQDWLLRAAQRPATTPYWPARNHRLAVRVALLLDDREGIRNALAYFATLPTLPAHLRDFRSAALLASEAGETGTAREMLHRLEQLDQQYPSRISRGAVNQIKAELALHDGRLEDAAEHLAAAHRAWDDIDMLASDLRLARARGDRRRIESLRQLFLERKGEILREGLIVDWVEVNRSR